MYDIIKLSLILYYLFMTSKSESSLKQLHILFRHGERSPSRTYSLDPYVNYSWPGGWGQLTNRGKLQIYNLGQNLRNEYSKFIPIYYWPQDVNVSSSYAERCQMSAQSLCAGMFPPRDIQIWNDHLLWQPIPVHYLPRSQDTNIAMKAKCDKYDKMFAEVQVSDKMNTILEENRDLLELLTKQSGDTYNSIEQVEILYNTLQIEELHNLTLPTWINTTMLTRMKKLGAQNLAIYSETEFMKRIKGGVFLKQVFSSMERILSGEKEPILHLYAGHDITLVHILRALNLVDIIKPEFGAYLVFELYTNGAVKIIYKNYWEGDSEDDLVKCQVPCKLPDLKKSLEAVLPTDYNKECQL